MIAQRGSPRCVAGLLRERGSDRVLCSDTYERIIHWRAF